MEVIDFLSKKAQKSVSPFVCHSGSLDYGDQFFLKFVAEGKIEIFLNLLPELLLLEPLLSGCPERNLNPRED